VHGGRWWFAVPTCAFGKVRSLYEKLDGKLQQAMAESTQVVGAFSAVHSAPLGDAACPDALGPDAPADFVAKPEDWCAYIDTLPGRVPGLYFYRLQTLDAAGNVSKLGPASPPVQVPEVFVPSAPVIIEAYAGTPEMRVKLAALRQSWSDFETGKSKVKPKEELEILAEFSGKATIVWSASCLDVERIGEWRIRRVQASISDEFVVKQPPDASKFPTYLVDGKVSWLFTSDQVCFVDNPGREDRSSYSVFAISKSGRAGAPSSDALVLPMPISPADGVVITGSVSAQAHPTLVQVSWTAQQWDVLVRCLIRDIGDSSWMQIGDWVPATLKSKLVPRLGQGMEVALLVKNGRGRTGITEKIVVGAA